MTKKYISFTIFFILFVAILCTPLQAMINYKVTITNPQTHYASVEIHFEANQDSMHISMPVWTPGSYLVREFARNVDRVNVFVGDQAVACTKTDKCTWQIDCKKGDKVKVVYAVYANEFSVRTSIIDADHAFLHTTSIFMMVDELKDQAGTIDIIKPSNWATISTSLEHKNGLYQFADYDELGDSPIEIGNQHVFEFDVMGAPHQVAMVGVNNANVETLKQDMQKICTLMANVVGLMPCKRYVFIVQHPESGGGGLEHKNSCTVVMPRWNYSDKAKYHGFLGLVAHEYFHLWNVKRIRPAALGPFDYKNENYTHLLWVSEGITSYYDEMSLHLFSYYSKQTYLDKLFSYVNKVENLPGIELQTLSESSWDAWIKGYRTNENSNNTQISYYSKGLLAAMCLDAEIIRKTNGTKNMDDLLKLLWKRFVEEQDRGFTDAEFTQCVSEICGEPMNQFMQDYIYGLKKLNYKNYFNPLNIDITYEQETQQVLGISLDNINGKSFVKEVNSQGCAYLGGLNVGDELIALNGTRISNNLSTVLSNQLAFTKQMHFMVSRDGLIKELIFEFKPLLQHSYKTVIKEDNGLQNKFFRQ